ncbi:MAG: diguanylate cyclase, partial [Desulfuromonadales bacterium]|nr:diguanylate cyclase [Desulfuromonadales bacterium]
ILQTYSIFLQQFQMMTERVGYSPELGILQDKLFNSLEVENISSTIYPADIKDLIENKTLLSLFDQVVRSSRARFRYTSDLGEAPYLMVASPLYDHGETTRILLLQSEMGQTFLHEIASSLNITATLISLSGEVLAQSHPEATPLELTPAQINHIGQGHKLYIDHDNASGLERHQYSIIPLGSSDMVILALESSLKRTSEMQQQLVGRMILILLGIVLFGLIIYFRVIDRVTRPARELNEATNAISRGNLKYRILNVSNDELGHIAHSFNQMAEDLENSYQERASKDIAKALSREEGRTRALLERKEQERDKLNEDLNVLQKETSALYQLNQAMTSAMELASLFDRILQVMNEILACDHIVLLVYSPGDSALEVVRTVGLDSNCLDNVRFTFDQGVTGEAAQSQRMIYIKDLDQDDRSLSYHGQIVTRGSMISAPLIIKGRLVGIINLHKNNIDAFALSELKLIQAVANQTAIAIDNAQLMEKTRDLSNTDELTGLSNRRYFQEILKREVAQARRFSSIFSIVMCEIDNFKTIYDELGKVRGDALLRQAGQALLRCTRGIDLVCRFGNEQFVVLLPKTDKKGAFATAEKLRKHIEGEDFAKLIAGLPETHLTMSFGTTEFPVDSKNIYELLNLADRSLYAAKKDGQNCTVAWESAASAPK